MIYDYTDILEIKDLESTYEGIEITYERSPYEGDQRSGITDRELLKYIKYLQEEKTKSLETYAKVLEVINYLKNQNRFIEGCDINLTIDWKQVIEDLEDAIRQE